ncbi:MAG: hypothetical protein CVU89_14690 [Firmicutes bacterium HGW-Firmicutes-14]|jgi:hypothetical protein|nr:MAG: hypothetical protein CVU89_14690 [Firmicutes bacterium HGW-Firmicutes-14]
MKIQDYGIVMSGTRFYEERHEKSESLKMWVGSQRPDFEGRASQGTLAAKLDELKTQLETLRDNMRDVVVELSDEAKAAQGVKESEELEEFKLTGEDKLKIIIVEKMIAALTGKKIKIKVPEIKRDCEDLTLDELKAKLGEGNGDIRQREGWGIEYDYHEMYYEHEQTSFSAQGIVRTADGKEIDFSVDLTMSRTFMQEQNISIRAGDAVKVDPLVINFDGPAAELTNTKFSFDLDSDGKEDQISFVRPGSGFLSLDKNNDGVINDGSELFGPQTGNGFEELAAYDEDKNLWIDENDTIFDRLRIWTRDPQGNNVLTALGHKGIGAIYLGNIITQFNLTNSQNEVQGQVNRTGIFLKESGTAGTVQQVDLTV